jgi:hypothetical protein
MWCVVIIVASVHIGKTVESISEAEGNHRVDFVTSVIG